jgi:hypothetical protein
LAPQRLALDLLVEAKDRDLCAGVAGVTHLGG